MPAKSATSSNPFSVLGDTLESAAETFEEATANAQHSAKKAAETAKRALGTGFYKASYGISYGVVYGITFLTQLIPEENAIRRGLVEGAHDAIESGEAAVRRKKAQPSPSSKSKTASKVTKTPALKSVKLKVSPKTRSVVKSRAAKFDAAA